MDAETDDQQNTSGSLPAPRAGSDPVFGFQRCRHCVRESLGGDARLLRGVPKRLLFGMGLQAIGQRPAGGHRPGKVGTRMPPHGVPALAGRPVRNACESKACLARPSPMGALAEIDKQASHAAT